MYRYCSEDKKIDAKTGLMQFITQVLIKTLFDVDELVERISEANQSLPSPVVSVEETIQLITQCIND